MNTNWQLAAIADNFFISTPRLQIRPLGEQDLQLYLDLYSNVDTMVFVAEPLTADQAANSFRVALSLNSKKPFKRLFLAIFEQGKAAGLCAINQWSEQKTQVEVGIMLLQQWHGKGFATEALAALIQRVQQKFYAALIKGDLDPDNKAAVQLVLKTGFKPDPFNARTYWVDKKV